MDDKPGLITLCDVADVGPDTPARAEIDGQVYAIFEVDGKYYVTQDECTHGPGSLCEGVVFGDEIECPFHLGRFHIPSGQPTLSPCTEPLRVWTVHLRDGRICIDPNERALESSAPSGGER